jgi:hypothetical protein
MRWVPHSTFDLRIHDEKEMSYDDAHTLMLGIGG